MAFSFSTNNSYVNGAVAVYTLKELLKSVGWAVVASGDGVSNYSGSGDVITSGNTGANGLNNVAAWFRITSPNNVKEFLFERTGSALNWNLYYSAFEKFIGGAPDANTIPTATDSKTLLDDDQWFVASNVSYFSCGADSSNGYGFYMFTIPSSGQNSGRPNGGCILYEPMITGSYPSEDPDPYVIYISGSNTAFSQAELTTQVDLVGSSVRGWLALNDDNKATFHAVPAMKLSINTTTVIPLGTGGSFFDGYDQLYPIVFARPAASTPPHGYKGVGRNAKWIGMNRSTGSLMSVDSSGDYIYVHNIALPWNGDEPLL